MGTSEALSRCVSNNDHDVSISTDNLRDVRKCLRQAGRQQFKPMSALRFFTVNAALLMNMLSALTTYSIVLLQINFL